LRSGISNPRFRRRAATYWSVMAFLGGFVVLLLVVSHYFLLPGLKAAETADAAGRRQLRAVSWLILSIVLVYVLAGLMLTFRMGRFFFPRKGDGRVKTKYVDAWTEAGHRARDDSKEQ
jgi:hypothetical protein